MPFNIALSGLRASSTDLEVTGNNIANASTVGFKRTRAEFGDVYSNSFAGGSTAVGDGVTVLNTRQLFSQGNVSFTDSSLDLAITGNGFFVMDDQGEAKYTRAGQFGVDQQGFLVNSTGMQLQGFQADATGTVSGVLGDLIIDTNDLPPSRTTAIDAVLNLDSTETVLSDSGTNVASDGTSVGVVQAGTTNGYLTQTIDVTLANGTTSSVVTAANSSAGAIASQFSLIDGVDATASTTASLLSANYANTSGTMTVTLNGINFQPTGATTALQLADLGTKINASSLVGVTAVIDPGTGDLRIIQDQGGDLVFGFAGTAADRFDIAGTDAGPTSLVMGTGQTQSAVGGTVNIILDDGVSVANGSGTTPIVANFTGQPFINNVFEPTDPGTYNHATSTTIFDSLGNSHVITNYFVKQENTTQANTWQMHVLVDGQDVGDPLIGTTASRATFNVVFNDDGTINNTLTDSVLISNWVPVDATGSPNGADGPLNVVNGGALPIPVPPTSSNFLIDIGSLTQYGSPFAVNDLSQNGYTTGRLVGLDVDSSGIILSRFSNGESLVLGQAALANFNAVEGLAPSGDTVWVQTFASGDPIVGAPGTASLGLLTASAVEQSNVDLSEELVNLIVAQRNFQANSKTIETADTIQQTIINI